MCRNVTMYIFIALYLYLFKGTFFVVHIMYYHLTFFLSVFLSLLFKSSHLFCSNWDSYRNFFPFTFTRPPSTLLLFSFYCLNLIVSISSIPIFFCLCLVMTTLSFTSLFHTSILFCTYSSFCPSLNQSLPQIVNIILLIISSFLSFFFHIPSADEDNFCNLIFLFLLCGNIVCYSISINLFHCIGLG